MEVESTFHKFYPTETRFTYRFTNFFHPYVGDLIALLERKTGRRFERAKLDTLMQRIDVQERALWDAARAIGEAPTAAGKRDDRDAVVRQREVAHHLHPARQPGRVLDRNVLCTEQ